MAIRLQLTVLLTITLLTSLRYSQATAAFSYTLLPDPSLQQPQTTTTTTLSPPPIQESISTGTLLAPILTNLGFLELAMAVPSLTDSTTNSSFVAWNGPVTLFAPADKSIRSCVSCSVPRLLREHIVRGIFTVQYLTKLAVGTKLETLNPSRCITITSSSQQSSSSSPTLQNFTKIFIDGVEITHPDLFNDGLVVVHGLQGFVSPLSASSCNPTTPSPPPELANVRSFTPSYSSSAIMRLMLRDAMVRLRDGGYSVLSLVLRLKYAELANLKNITVFALDDAAVFSGGHAYVSNVRFHIVPDRLLMHTDLKRLPAGTVLQTMVPGQSLMTTSSGESLRINYVPIKSPDVLYNSRIAVHGIFLPFPHLGYSVPVDSLATAAAGDGIFESPPPLRKMANRESCAISGSDECAMAPHGENDFIELDDGL